MRTPASPRFLPTAIGMQSAELNVVKAAESCSQTNVLGIRESLDDSTANLSRWSCANMAYAMPPHQDSEARDGGESVSDDYDPAQRFKLGIDSLSNLVFGLALGIGSAILTAKLPQSAHDLVIDVSDFAFSFLILILVWVGYRRTVITLPHETRGTLIVNIILLFFVAVEPFLFYVVVASSAIVNVASSVYAVDIGAMLIMLAVLSYLLLSEEEHKHKGRLHVAVMKSVRQNMFTRLVVGAIFLASALPIFWIASPVGYFVRMDLWFASLALIFIMPRILQHSTSMRT